MTEVINVNQKKELDTQIVYQNIILHLKCKKSDLKSVLNIEFMAYKKPNTSPVHFIKLNIKCGYRV